LTVKITFGSAMHSVARDRRALTRQRYHFISDPAGGLAPALTVALGGKGEEIETRIKSETGEEEGPRLPARETRAARLRASSPARARNAFRFLCKSYRRL